MTGRSCSVPAHGLDVTDAIFSRVVRSGARSRCRRRDQTAGAQGRADLSTFDQRETSVDGFLTPPAGAVVFLDRPRHF